MSFAEQYGPWALIAGASEGTGAAFARQVAAAGVNCFLVARELRSQHGIECRTASIDLAAGTASQQLAEVTAEHEVGLFINNAGSDPNASDDQAGYAVTSAAARGQRVAGVAAASSK